MKTDDVREYYSNVFDLLRIHRKKFTYARELYKIRKTFSFDEIDKEIYEKDSSICNTKLQTNKTCNFYLTKLFSICNDNNYENIYNLGHNIIDVYDQNIKYLDSKILEGEYLKRGIAYTSNMDYEKNFEQYAEKEYQKIKIYK